MSTQDSLHLAESFFVEWMEKPKGKIRHERDLSRTEATRLVSGLLDKDLCWVFLERQGGKPFKGQG